MIARACICAASLTVLAGCAQMDPYDRPGMWQPSGVVVGNLAAMAADPHDLVRGRGDAGGDRNQSGGAVLRLWLDRPKPFLGASEGSTPAPGAAPPAPSSGPPPGGT